jgi:hypothetical protein
MFIVPFAGESFMGLDFSFLCVSRVSLLCTFEASTVSTASAHRKELNSLYVNDKGNSLEVS